MSGTQATANMIANAVSNGGQPNVGAVYSFMLTLVTGTPQAVDLKSLVNLQRINEVQGILVDNTAGTTALVVSTAAGQYLVVPAGDQALMPLYLSADKVITFAGNVSNMHITLLNFPTPACVWGSASGPGATPSAPAYTKSAALVSAGAGTSFTVTTSPQALDPPIGASSAVISIVGGNVMVRDDGFFPTSTVGLTFNVGLTSYNGPLNSFRFLLAEGVSTATLFASFYE